MTSCLGPTSGLAWVTSCLRRAFTTAMVTFAACTFQARKHLRMARAAWIYHAEGDFSVTFASLGPPVSPDGCVCVLRHLYLRHRHQFALSHLPTSSKQPSSSFLSQPALTFLTVLDLPTPTEQPAPSLPFPTSSTVIHAITREHSVGTIA